jgi:hypothetical protein
MNYNNNHKIISREKANEYNDISLEVEGMFQRWLAYGGLDEMEFDYRMKAEPHRIEESVNGDGIIEINIFAGNEKVIVPLAFLPDGSGSLDDFLVNAILVFSHIANRYENKSFENAVNSFAKRMISENKMTI